MLCPLSCSCNHSIVTTGVVVVVCFCLVFLFALLLLFFVVFNYYFLFIFFVSLYPYSLNWSNIDLFNDAINTF